MAVTKKDVKEVKQALKVMCKWCEQGMCECCPDEETLERVKEMYEDGE